MTEGQDTQHYAYLRSSRLDPAPWDETAGPGTSPMPILSPPVLAELDRQAAEAARRPLSRVEARRQRKARRRALLVALATATLAAFVLAFLVGRYLL